MAKQSTGIEVCVEAGARRTFASAIRWPGWSRSGTDERSALQALADYGSRYSRVIRGVRLGFQASSDLEDFSVIERLTGNATTDFGAPAVPCSIDSEAIDADDLREQEAILKACWRAFDEAIDAAGRRRLQRGPRGGGRELNAIVDHAMGADAAYLGRLGWPFKLDENAAPSEEMRRLREEILRGLTSAVEGEIDPRGPRGGLRWTPRYFIRRSAWHILDHAWEIEDRTG
jgi:hypothetical protein